MWGFIRKDLNTFSDENLIKEIAAGNSTAFTLLYQRYSSLLYRYFLRLLYQDKAKAEDFLQDLFLKILHSSASFDSRQKAKTWIYTIATNMCRNHWRNEQYQKQWREQYQAPESSESHILLEKIDAELFSTIIEELLDNLESTEREVILLRFQEELSIKEIALIVNLPEGTIKSKIFYLLKKIAKKMHLYEHLKNS